MALVPIRIDRTSKPPLGTPLRSDGHWSVQGLVGAWALNEGGGGALTNAVGLQAGKTGTNNYWSPDGVSRYGNGYGGSLLPCKVNQNRSTYIVKFSATQANGNGFNYIQGIGYRKKAILLHNNASVGFSTHTDWGTWSFYAPGVIPLNSPTSVGISIDFSSNPAKGVIFVNSQLVLNEQIAFGGTLDDETGSEYHLGEDNEVGWGLYGNIYYSLIYDIILPPDQIALISANPWQIYEPELVWIEVPDGTGGTTYTDTLTALAESYASVTDVATYVDAATALITAGVDATSVITMTEAVLTTAQAADTVADTMQRLESVLSVVQAADTVADAQAMAESLVSEITASVSVADSLNNSSTESLATEIAAASTVQDVVTILEQVHTTLEAQATVVDEQTSGAAENLVTSATAITSATDLQLMVDNVTVMAQSGVAIGEISSYLEGVVSAATSGASVADTIIGAMQKLFPLTVAGRDPLALSVLWRDPLTLNIAVST